MIVAIVAQLFCARRLTLEQVRRAADVFIRCLGLPRRLAQQEYEAELARIAYHQRRQRRSESSSSQETPIMRWESILINSKASSQNPSETKSKICKVALSPEEPPPV